MLHRLLQRKTKEKEVYIKQDLLHVASRKLKRTALEKIHQHDSKGISELFYPLSSLVPQSKRCTGKKQELKK